METDGSMIVEHPLNVTLFPDISVDGYAADPTSQAIQIQWLLAQEAKKNRPRLLFRVRRGHRRIQLR